MLVPVPRVASSQFMDSYPFPLQPVHPGFAPPFQYPPPFPDIRNPFLFSAAPPYHLCPPTPYPPLPVSCSASSRDDVSARGGSTAWRGQCRRGAARRGDRQQGRERRWPGPPSGGQVYKCCTCQRSYKSEETYQTHLESHVKCDVCDFAALPKLVREHSTVHTLPNFLKATTPEEIRKWRDERRRNYPTAANVARKKRQEAGRQSRRQVLDTPLYRYVNQLIGNYEQGRGGRGRRRGRFTRRDHTAHKSVYQHTSPESNVHSGGDRIDMAAGANSAACSTGEPLLVTPDLSTELSATDRGQTAHETGFQRCNWRGRRRRGRSQRVARLNASSAKWKRRASDWERGGLPGKKKWLTLQDIVPRRATLLEKLLGPEIRREQNTVLQCVRYILKRQFLDTPTTSSDMSTTNSDTPTTNCDIPTTNSDTPTTNSDTPTTNCDIPTTNSDTPTTNSDTPTTNSDTPTTNSDVPTTNSDTPTTDSDTPTTSSNMPTTSSNTPFTNGDTPTTSSNMPSINGDMPTYQQ